MVRVIITTTNRPTGDAYMQKLPRVIAFIESLRACSTHGVCMWAWVQYTQIYTRTCMHWKKRPSGLLRTLINETWLSSFFPFFSLLFKCRNLNYWNKANLHWKLKDPIQGMALSIMKTENSYIYWVTVMWTREYCRGYNKSTRILHAKSHCGPAASFLLLWRKSILNNIMKSR